MKLTVLKADPKLVLFYTIVVLSAHCLGAQTTVTTGGGASGSLPIYTSGSNIENSNITQNGYNVSVNGFVTAATAAGGPFFTAHQLGTSYGYPVAMFSAITDDPAGWVNYYFQVTTAGDENFWIRADGAAYFGDTVQVDGPPLATDAGSTSQILSLTNDHTNVNYLNFTQIRNSPGSDWTTTTTRVQNVTDFTPQGYLDFNPANGAYGVAIGSGSSEFMRFTRNGSVGIGTLTPSAALEVNGNFKLTSGSGASVTYADGTVQTTAYVGTSCPVMADLVTPDKTIVAQGGDYAESVDVGGDRTLYEPGDVMVIILPTPSASSSPQRPIQPWWRGFTRPSPATWGVVSLET